jgi:putative ABC transport system permease protein
MLVVIALRNLFRNRRRTALSLVIVSVGIISLLLTAGFVRNSFDGLREAVIMGGLGHLEVAPAADGDSEATAAERSGRPPGLQDWRHLQTVIETRPRVRAAGAVVQFSGVITAGAASASFIGLAVEPGRESRMGFEMKLRSGSNLEASAASEQDNSVLLGVGLAHALNVAPGDSITIMAATPDGSLNAADMVVDGVFTTGVQELDGRILKCRVSTAQRLLGTDLVTSLIVTLTDTGSTREAERDLSRQLSPNAQRLSILSWDTRAPFYNQVRALYTGIFTFLGTIVAVLVALSTSNTMLMSVLERVREFGTLLAVGTSRRQLSLMLTCEALWLAVLGGGAGTGLGLVVVSVINHAHIEMPAPPGAVDPIPLMLTVAPLDVLIICAAMKAILALASVPPMLRVFRLRIVAALGHV